MSTGIAASAPRRNASPDSETNKENRRPSPTAVTFTRSTLAPPPASSSPPTATSAGIGGLVRRLSRKTSRGRRPAPAAPVDEDGQPRTRVRPKSAAPVLESLDVGTFNNSPTPGGDDGDLPEGGSVRFGSGAQFGGPSGTIKTNGSAEEDKGGLSNLVRKMSRKLAVRPNEPYSGARARSRTVGNNPGYTPPVHRGEDGSWVHTPTEERDFSHIPLHKPPSFLNMAGTGALSSFAPRPPLKPNAVAGPSSPRHGRSPLSAAPVNRHGNGSDDEREVISEKEREAFGDRRPARPQLRSYASTPSYRTISSLEEREREREREEANWRNQGRAHAHPGTTTEMYQNRQVADSGSAIWGGNGAGDDMAF